MKARLAKKQAQRDLAWVDRRARLWADQGRARMFLAVFRRGVTTFGEALDEVRHAYRRKRRPRLEAPLVWRR